MKLPWLKTDPDTQRAQNTVALHPSFEGQLLDQTRQAALSRKRDEEALGRAIGDRNRWFLITCMLVVAVIFCANGWRIASNRFANNVQVSYVKLDPSGGYTVEFYDANRPVEFFQATVDAKLMEWVDRRYSKLKETIRVDYGFVYVFMAPEVQRHFMQEYGAIDVATEFATCPQCDQITVKTRVIQHLSEVAYVAARSKDEQTIYHSIAYATQLTRNYAGSLISTENVIINLTWRFKTLAQIQSERKNLNQNPVGIEMLRYELKTDANTLPVEQSS